MISRVVVAGLCPPFIDSVQNRSSFSSMLYSWAMLAIWPDAYSALRLLPHSSASTQRSGEVIMRNYLQRARARTTLALLLTTSLVGLPACSQRTQLPTT